MVHQLVEVLCLEHPSLPHPVSDLQHSGLDNGEGGGRKRRAQGAAAADEGPDRPVQDDQAINKQDEQGDSGAECQGSESKGSNCKRPRVASTATPLAMQPESAGGGEAEVEEEVARIDEEEGRHEEKFGDKEECLSDKDESLYTMCQRAQELFEVAQDYDGAEVLYKRVLALDPNHVDTLCNYALLIEFTQDEHADQKTAAAELEHAEALYRHAAFLEPNRTDVLYQHALFLKNVRGDYDGAEQLMLRVLELDPLDATAMCNYALLLHHVRKDAPAAQRVYQRALALPNHMLSDEESVSLLYSYASLCQTSLNDAEHANKLFRAALALAPSDATVLNSLASLQHLHFNDTAQAEQLYQRALECEPENVEVMSNYALLLQHLKRHAQAYKLLRRFYCLSSLSLSPLSLPCLSLPCLLLP